jgi:DNA anti-recombination protein RmuC
MLEMRESWTDRRLDDFAAHVDHRFDQVDKRFEQVDRRFEQMHTDLQTMQLEMTMRFDAQQADMNRRFDAMHRLMLQSSVATVIGLLGVIATQV